MAKSIKPLAVLERELAFCDETKRRLRYFVNENAGVRQLVNQLEIRISNILDEPDRNKHNLPEPGCDSCLFFFLEGTFKEAGIHFGHCRRFPGSTHDHPMVSAWDWCGEFKSCAPKTKPTPAS